MTPEEHRARAIQAIRVELRERLEELEAAGKLLERQRLEQRTMFDLEMLEQMGFCQGIENYSRHLSGREAGEPPPTLIDYFPDDFIIVLDESHQTIPQIGAMYRGDRARKEVSSAKIHVADTLHKAADTGIQLNGARGYSSDTVLEWIYRYARCARLVDGASEVHKMVLARAYDAEGGDFWQWGA